MSTKTFSRSKSHKSLILISVTLFLLFSGHSCGLLGYEIYKALDDDGGNSSEENYSPNVPAVEATSTYYIAIGGVAPGRDELIIVGKNGELLELDGHNLDFETDSGVVGLMPRPGYETFAAGSGAQIIPQYAGFATISYYIDDELQSDKFLVVVPPQSLIQIMVAEAANQLTKEAETDEDYHVKLDSSSTTASAIGSVIRNRVELTFERSDYSLFNVDKETWLVSPDASYYDAVITAEKDGIYQFSPVDPLDITHSTYENAEAREFLDPQYHRAYDQAVISAAKIFASTTTDTTKESFGFFSPTQEEWEKIEMAYTINMITMPVGAGISDEDYPELSPIQIYIIDGIWKYVGGRPSFVFIRTRESTDYAVVK